MRILALTFGLLLAFTGLAAAQSFATPRDLLEAFYAPYETGEFLDDESIFRSTALNAAYAADEENTPVGEMGALSFDPYIDGQDYELADFVIAEPAIDGARASVEVSFRNFDRPTTLTYELVNENGGWKIDDVVSLDAEYPYRLTEIFEEAKAYW